MGLRGPAKKPVEVAAKQGFPSRQRGEKRAHVEAATIAAEKPDDSRSVQSDIPASPAFIRHDADAVAIWTILWSAPDAQARVRLKETDSAFLARYCWKRARVEAWMSRPKIKAKYTTTNTAGAKVVKTDPEYTEMMQLSRELTTDEALIGLTPRHRVDLAARLADLRNGDKPTPASAPKSTPTPASAAPPRPASPLDLLATKPPAAASKH